MQPNVRFHRLLACAWEDHLLCAIDSNSGKEVIVQHVDASEFSDDDIQKIYEYVEFMMSLDAHRFVSYVGVFPDIRPGNQGLLWVGQMEDLGAGSMADIMHELEEPLSEEQCSVVLREVLRGLALLHTKKSTTHGDVRADSIFIQPSGGIKLGPLASARNLFERHHGRRSSVIGAPYWMAPERIRQDVCGAASDIWSLGITAIELAEGKPPDFDVHPMRILFLRSRRDEPCPALDAESFSPDFCSFVSECLKFDPKERGTAGQLLMHPFICGAQSISCLRALIRSSLGLTVWSVANPSGFLPPSTRTKVVLWLMVSRNLHVRLPRDVVHKICDEIASDL